MKLVARKCEVCGKHRGVFAYVYNPTNKPGQGVTGYFHEACFMKFKRKLLCQ